jgi:hypothetical protein
MLDVVRDIGCDRFGCDWIDVFPSRSSGGLRPSRTDGTAQEAKEEQSILALLWERRHKYRDRLAGPDVAARFAVAMDASSGSPPHSTGDETSEQHGSGHSAASAPWFMHNIWAGTPHPHEVAMLSRVKRYYPELWADADEPTPVAQPEPQQLAAGAEAEPEPIAVPMPTPSAEPSSSPSPIPSPAPTHATPPTATTDPPAAVTPPPPSPPPPTLPEADSREEQLQPA